MSDNLKTMTRIEIGQNYPEVVKLIDDAVEFSYGEIDREYILKQLESGRYLGVGEFSPDNSLVGFMTVRTVQYEKQLSLRVVSLGGLSLEGWEEAITFMDNLAIQFGATHVECCCRPGAATIGKKNFRAKQQYATLVRKVGD